MDISADAVKELRDKTGISVMECKKALIEAEGNMDKAIELLKARSAVMAAKKSDREFGAGLVVSYIHSTGQVGALLVLVSETDFVSKNEEFAALGRDIAMHVTAMRPDSIETLLTQAFIKDDSKTIQELLSAATQKFGERVEIKDLSCFSVR